MAIALDATTNSGANVASFSHTCTGASRILWVMAANGLTDVDPSGITYGGVAMTKLVRAWHANDTRAISLWYLLSPATGSNTVALSGTGGFTVFDATAVSYTGVSQNIPPQTQTQANVGAALSRTATVTTTTANNWLIMGAAATSQSPAAGAGATLRSAGNFRGATFDSNGTVANGAASMTVTFASSESATIIASFRPGFEIACATGSFALTGSDITFLRALVFPLATGSFALTGAAMTALRSMPLDTAVYSLSGSALTFRRITAPRVRATNVTSQTVKASI